MREWHIDSTPLCGKSTMRTGAALKSHIDFKPKQRLLVTRTVLLGRSIAQCIGLGSHHPAEAALH